MTIPWMTNCEHTGEGWCLYCVGKLVEENQRLKEKIRELEDYIHEKDEAEFRHRWGPD